jgi:death-on-curing protein
VTTSYLTLPLLLRTAERTLGEVLVRDMGLLASALARPQTIVFGDEAYVGLNQKAAALTHSIANNHGLVDGNKRLALAALMAFLGLNGRRLTLTEDAAYDLIYGIASGVLDGVEEIALILDQGTEDASY